MVNSTILQKQVGRLGQVQVVVDAAGKYVVCPVEELLGENFLEPVAPECRERNESLFKRLFLHGGEYYPLMRLVDGEWWVSRVSLANGLKVCTGYRVTNQDQVSDRELQISWLLSLGFDTKQIASQLFISPNTVTSHIEHLREKYGW
jgi:hypothetical protein